LREAERIAEVERMAIFSALAPIGDETTAPEANFGANSRSRAGLARRSGGSMSSSPATPTSVKKVATRSRSPSEERACIKRRQKWAEYCNIACNIYHTVVTLVLDTAAMVAAIRSDAGVAEQCAFRSCGDRLRNPDDDMVLEAAVNGRADAIVTFNHRDFAPAAEKF
jgi:hypothetical protein